MRLIPVTAVCLVLASCAADPIDNPGTWKVAPKGLTSNDENLRAMLVNPRDLTRGTGEAGSLGITDATAVRRELTGRRAPLLNANTSSATLGGGAQNQQGLQQQNAAATGRAE